MMLHAPPRSFQIATEKAIAATVREPGLVLRTLSWTAAAGITLGLHVSVFMALTRVAPLPPVEDVPTAAIMINLAPVPVMAISTIDNAADGPESAETEPQVAETPEATETPPPPSPEPETLPELPPPQLEVKPDAVLPPKLPEAKPMEIKPPDVVPPEPVKEIEPVKPKPEAKVEPPPEKPKKPVEKAKPKKVERKPQVASKRGGGPVSTVKTGETTAAPTTGGTGVSASAVENWIAKMRSRVQRAKRFPKDASGETYGGTTLVVTFSGDGSVAAARITVSSGSAILDREALATIYRAAPFAKTPDGQPRTQKIGLNFARN